MEVVKMKKSLLFLCFFILPIVYAGNIRINMSGSGDIKYNAVVDTPEQYNSVYVETKDSVFDFNYWINYADTQITSTTNVYNNYISDSKGARIKEIYERIGKGFLSYTGEISNSDYNYLDRFLNDSITSFDRYIMKKVFNKYIYPLYIEQEINKRMIRKINDRLKSNIECEVVDDMIKEGWFKEHECYYNESKEIHTNQSIVLKDK